MGHFREFSERALAAIKRIIGLQLMATDVLSRIRWLAIIYSARAWHNALDGPTAWGARSDTIGGSRRTNVFPSQETRTKTSIAAGGMGATASSEGAMGLDPLFWGQ